MFDIDENKRSEEEQTDTQLEEKQECKNREKTCII